MNPGRCKPAHIGVLGRLRAEQDTTTALRSLREESDMHACSLRAQALPASLICLVFTPWEGLR
jgi:hypothetical protein